MLKTNQKIISVFFFLLISFLLALDSVGSPTTSAKLIGILAQDLFLPALALQVVFHWRWQLNWPKKFSQLIGRLVIPGLAVGTTILSVMEASLPVNQTFALTRMQTANWGILLAFVGLSWLINQTRSWWQSHYLAVLSWTPIVFFGYCWLVFCWPFNYFLEWVKEDQLIENLQAGGLLGGGVFLLAAAFKSWRAKKFWLTSWLMFLSFGLILVAGDEISWGQRIFHWQTPTEIKELNRQQETTLHNLTAVEWLVGWGYLVISWLGLLGRPIATYLTKIARLSSPLTKIFISWWPTINFAGYFLVPAIYHTISRTQPWGIWPAWSEIVELYLYAGLAGWFSYRASQLVDLKSRTSRAN